MCIVQWICEFSSNSTGSPSQVFTLKRQTQRKLYVELNISVKETIAHCYCKGHLALLVDKDQVKDWIDHSRVLEEALQTKLELGFEVILGNSMEEAIINNEMLNKAERLQTCFYSLIDVGFAAFSETVVPSRLVNIKLLIHNNQDENLPLEDSEETD